MGIVEVTCIKLSLVVQSLESHELPIMIVTTFVLLMWWMLCLWDDLWDAKMFMFLMYEYMYMLTHSCILVLGACGGCVHYLEQSCSWFGEMTEISEQLWFLPFYGCLTRENGLLCIKVEWQKGLLACKDSYVLNVMLQFFMQAVNS
jgi:hypothetical protein